MLRRVLLVLVVLPGIMIATPAIACECSSNPVDPQIYLHDASLVFEGEVLDRPLTGWVLGSVVFRVLSPMKGRLGEQVTLDQSRAGNCAAAFKAGEHVRIVAYGVADGGYWTSACSLYPLEGDAQRDEVWAVATANRQHTLSLGGADISSADSASLRRLIRWHAEYGSFEEGLDAVGRLLELEPGDPEASQFKAEFLATSESKRKKLW